MEPDEQLRAADRVRDDVRRRSRWYPVWVLAFGLVGALVVTCVPVLQNGFGGLLFVALMLAWTFGLRLWKSRQLVQPVTSRRALRWAVPWAVLYVLVVLWIGPVYLGDDRVGLWAVAGLVVGVPAYVEAAVAWWRLSR